MIHRHTTDGGKNDIQAPIPKSAVDVLIAPPVVSSMSSTKPSAAETVLDLELLRKVASLASWPHLGKLSALRCSSAGFGRKIAVGPTSAGDQHCRFVAEPLSSGNVPFNGETLHYNTFTGSAPPACDDELAKHESYRLGTFAGVWAYDHIVDARDLARNGFFYAGPGDRVQCVFCHGLLRNWEPGDRVDEQHAQHFNYWRFVQGHEVGNVPIAFWPLAAKQTDDMHATDTTADATGAELCITCSPPKNPDFSIEIRCLATYNEWPAISHVTPESLAEAGFIYCGKNDAVKCFVCGGTFADRRTNCDLCVEHAQCYRDCASPLQAIAHGRVQRLLRRLATVGSDQEMSEQLLDDVFRTHDEKQKANSNGQNAAYFTGRTFASYGGFLREASNKRPSSWQLFEEKSLFRQRSTSKKQHTALLVLSLFVQLLGALNESRIWPNYHLAHLELGVTRATVHLGCLGCGQGVTILLPDRWSSLQLNLSESASWCPVDLPRSLSRTSPWLGLGGGGGAASSRADATSSFTVFVSPPWSVPSSIKHVTFSEAFPAIGGLGVGGGRRARMTLSRSLESIPENAVWHAGKGVGAAAAGVPGGGAASRDPSASIRGALLPPIRQAAAAIAGGDLDLPEMRARAFSDPNAYQTASTRDRHQHGAAVAIASNHPIRAAETGSSGSGLSKVGGPSTTTAAAAGSTAAAAPRLTATPPKKPPSPKQTRKAAAPTALSTTKRSQHESNGGSDEADSPLSAASAAGGQSPSKERVDVRLGGGGSKAAIAADRVLNALAADAAGPTAAATHRLTTTAAAGGHSSQPSAATSLLKAGGGSGAAAMSSHAITTAAAAGNGARGRMSTGTAAAGADLPSPPPPLAAAQRNHSKAASSSAAAGIYDEHAPTGVQPRIVHPPNVDRGGRGQLNRHTRHAADKEVDTSRTAFALVGSPGRRRWPSPHREATSFISATPPGRSMASAAAAATAASHGGSHSYSGPMSPLAAAVAREDALGSGSGGSGGSSVGGSEESLNCSGSGGDAGRWCSANALGAIDIPIASAAGAVSAGACSKEFQAILSGFIASGSAASAAAIGREGAYARDGRQAPDDTLAETRAHFLRAGCRPISDSL